MEIKQSFKAQNERFREHAKEREAAQLYMKELGFTVDKLEPGFCEGSMTIEKIHRQHMGFLHGGIAAVICDIVAGFAAYSLVKEGQTVVTANLSTNYLNPGAGARLIARGRVQKAGSRLIFCEAEILVNNDGTEFIPVTAATAIMSIIDDVPVKI